MKTTMALIFKFIATFAAAWISFNIIDASPMSWIFIVALTGTILNYVVGDLAVLPAFGNVIASVGDGIMGALTAYIIDLFMPNFTVSLTSLIIFALLIALTEYFFHIYLRRSDKVAP